MLSSNFKLIFAVVGVLVSIEPAMVEGQSVLPYSTTRLRSTQPNSAEALYSVLDNGVHVVVEDIISTGYKTKDNSKLNSIGWNADQVQRFYEKQLKETGIKILDGQQMSKAVADKKPVCMLQVDFVLLPNELPSDLTHLSQDSSIFQKRLCSHGY